MAPLATSTRQCASHRRAMRRLLALSILVIATGLSAAPRLDSREAHMGVAGAAQPDPLPSWNDGKPKRNILTFVQSVADQSGPDYVPPAARIAVFDNDGTLWSEQPLYIQPARFRPGPRQPMLQWTAAGPARRLMLLVDHTDAEREFAYRVSPMGRLTVALAEARQRGWAVVSMKDDWKRIFAFE